MLKLMVINILVAIDAVIGAEAKSGGVPFGISQISLNVAKFTSSSNYVRRFLE